MSEKEPQESQENQESQNEEASKETPLFRKEVIDAKTSNYFGKTLIVSPISHMIWTIGIISIAVTIALYVFLGEYSKKQTVFGVLIPDKGLISIYAKNSGTILKKFIQQGEEIKKGDLLYLISTEQESLNAQSLSVQQVEILEKQIEVQKNKIAMFEKKAAGFKDLLEKHYISEMDYQTRQQQYLTARLELHEYEKQLNQARGGAEYAIRSPADGTISMLIAVVGDPVTQTKQLCSIVPKDSKLEAELYVPTSKAGFIKVGQKVLLKYGAYPYQRFGLYEATIARIDKSILDPKMFPIPVKVDEAFYRVTATLQKQTVNVYGNPYPLTPGMLFEGVILGERRYIWQWVFEPIYSLRGTL
jgi:membrane fusion protein